MCMCVLVTQSCLTLCNPMDYSPPSSSAHGTVKVGILEWAAMHSSRGLFLTQGPNPALRHWQVDSLLSEPPGKLYTCPAAAAAKSLQSCPTLCDPIDGSPPGLPVPGTLQARTLEWVAISFSNA